MNVEKFKEKVLDNLDNWIKGRVDAMVSNNPTLTLPSVYIKRGCHNILNKYRDKVEEGIDTAALFLADENGNIGINSMFKDAMEIFKSMEEIPFDLDLVKGTVGQGKISITLPDNILMNIIFGSRKTITLDESDFMEFKSLLLTEPQ